jgi:hypothetical protein
MPTGDSKHSYRVLDSIDRISEVLIGLIMVLGDHRCGRILWPVSNELGSTIALGG